MKKVRTIIRVHCRGTTDNPHTFDTKRIPHKINIDLMKWNWPTLADSQTINKRLSETPKIEIPMTRRRGPDTRAKSYCFIKTQSTSTQQHRGKNVKDCTALACADGCVPISYTLFIKHSEQPPRFQKQSNTICRCRTFSYLWASTCQSTNDQ